MIPVRRQCAAMRDDLYNTTLQSMKSEGVEDHDYLLELRDHDRTYMVTYRPVGVTTQISADELKAQLR